MPAFMRSARRRPATALALLCALGLFLTPLPPATEGAERKARPRLVAVAVAEVRPVAHRAEVTGSLVARRIFRAYTEERGRVVELPHHEGDRVAAGALLVRLDDALLRAELAKAEARRAQAEADLRRLQGLARRRLTSEEAIVAARTALALARAEEQALRIRIARTRITAPFAGVVSTRRAEPGDVVAPGDHLLTLVDPGSVVARAPVPEHLHVRLRAGQPARLRIDALGTGWLPARIVRVHPTVDERTHQGLVEVVPARRPEGMRPGLLCRLALAATPEQVLVVPAAAVQRDPAGAYVFRLEDGRARRVAVRTGRLTGEDVVVLEGLRAGDRVVVRGLLGLRDGAHVRIAGGGEAAGG